MHPISDEIEIEFAQVAREVVRLSAVVQRLDSGAALAPGSQEAWEASNLCASATEKIYTGCERIMAKLAAGMDGVRIGKEKSWHRSLLDRMRQPFQGRDAIITQDTYAALDRMRAFRHRERNTYGFDLDTEIVLERAREVIPAYEALVTDIRRFLKAWPGEMSRA